MLRAMSELEKAVNDLLGRFEARGGAVRRPEEPVQPPADGDLRAREREAAEWVRRALERLRTL